MPSIFNRVFRAGKDTATLITGQIGTGNVAGRSEAGISASAITASRFLEKHFRDLEASATKVKRNSRQGSKSVAQYNRQLAKNSVILNAQAIAEDVRQARIYVASMMHALGEVMPSFDDVFERFKDSASTQQTLAKDWGSQRSEIKSRIAELKKVVRILQKKDDDGKKALRKLKDAVSDSKNLPSSLKKAVEDADRDSEDLAQVKSDLDTWEELLAEHEQGKPPKFDAYVDLARGVKEKFDLVQKRLSTTAAFLKDPDFSSKVTAAATQQLSRALTDFYDTWEQIANMVESQVRIEQQLVKISGGSSEVREELAHQMVPQAVRITNAVVNARKVL